MRRNLLFTAALKRGRLHQQESRIENIYFLDSANGIIRATSEDGGSIYCEFKGLGSFGEGICMNSKGEKYKLLIHS